MPYLSEIPYRNTLAVKQNISIGLNVPHAPSDREAFNSARKALTPQRRVAMKLLQ